MHINLETDYAIRIVDILGKQVVAAKAPEQPARLDAKTISEKTDVPLRFALKILRKLGSSGVVKSYKGVYGGYVLCRPLSELSLYDIVELVEGAYHFSRCLCEGYSCTCSNKDELPCTYQRVFGDISDEVSKTLKAQTFDKLIKLQNPRKD